MARFQGTLVEDPTAQQAPAAPKPRFGGTPVEAPVQQATVPAPDGDLGAMVNAAATKYQLDPRLFRAQIEQESSMNPRAVSKAGAQGLGQLMPGTARDLGVTDPFDPAQNLEGSAKYMRQLLDRYQGDTDKALAAYNWGLGNVDKFGTKMMPKETRNYLSSIKSKVGAQAPAKPDLQGELQVFEKKAIDEGLRGADYYNQKADIMERYQRATGERPSGAFAEDLARGFGQGFLSDMNVAGNQLVGGLIPDVVERAVSPGGKTYNERISADERALERYRRSVGEGGMDPGRIVGNILNPVSLATGATGAVPKALASLGPKAQAAGMAALRGGVGAAATPVVPDEQGNILGPKAAQVATGAALGPVADVLVRGGTKAAGHIAGAIKNKMSSDEVQALDQLGKQWGVDLLAGDLDTNRRLIRGIEGRLINSQIPGLNISLEAQQAQGRAAAEKLLKIQNDELQKLTFQGLGNIKKIAAGGGKRAAEAQAVLRMVDESGDDARKMIQASGNLKWLRMKLSADQLFDEVERVAGKGDVTPTQTMQALNKAERQADKVVDIDRETLNLISGWRARLEQDPADFGPNTFGRMREFHTDLKNRIDNATSNGTTKSGQLWLQDVAKAVQKDMDAYAAHRPGLKAANERANAFYRDRVVPFQAPEMAKALRGENADNVWSAFVRSGAEWRGSHAQEQLFKALDEKGRAAVRAGMVEDAFRQATDPENFTPTGFNKILRQTGYETFFQGPARRELDGLMKIMDHIGRSDPSKLAAFTPLVGNLAGAGALTMMAGASGTASAPAVAAGMAATGFMKWLVTSDTGRRLLYSANLYKPGAKNADQAIAKILETARNQFTAATGTAAGLEQGKPGTVLP